MGALLDLKGICLDCLTLNGSAYLLVYAAFVFYVGVAYQSQWAIAPEHAQQSIPDLSNFSIPTASIQTMILQGVSMFLTPWTYILCLRYVAEKIDAKTGVSHRSFLKNVGIFLAFYYFIVSAPAAAMIPTHYDVKYDLQSITALFLMMLTNAIGDVLSYKITIHNVQRVFEIHKTYVDQKKQIQFADSLKTEFLLYRRTLIDMSWALIICFCVLVLTSIYFGVSVGEYKFELTPKAFEGAFIRATHFWQTVWEPYWFRQNIGGGTQEGLPMLLIYSVTSFAPTALFIIFSIFWTFVMPLRVIYFSRMRRFVKIAVSEFIVIAICVTSVSLWHIAF